MKEYYCEKCRQKYTGWGVGETCQKCGGKLKEVKVIIRRPTKEEMSKIVKGKVRKLGKKEIGDFNKRMVGREIELNLEEEKGS